LVQVVRTRQVRALTEKYYGRTARLFLFESTEEEGEGVRDVAAASLRRAAEEMLPRGDYDRTSFAFIRARVTPHDARRFARRLGKLEVDWRAADHPDG